MLRTSTLLFTTVAVLLASPSVGAEELLPRPEGLEPNVRFWTRVYTESDASGGLIHDSQHLDVVYEVVRFPSDLSRRARERRLEKTKQKYADILKQLARGKRTGLSEEEARVLGRWPAGVSDATLRTAARHVRFQLGQADRFQAGLVRAGMWRDYIEQTLDAAGVPVELAALPHVESSYNPKAYSRAGAAGLWQFTRSTGRLFLRIDHVVDERLDARKASVAAAKLLQGDYAKLGTWPLAITAYNHGVAGMARAVRKLGTTDIATISKNYDGRTFGFASRNFYAEFLAALEVDLNAERYFGPIHPERPQEFETVVLDHFYTPETLERAFGVDRETLREYNQSLRPSIWNGTKYVPRGYELILPPKTLSQSATEVLASIPVGERKVEQHRDRFYKVRRGDTLSKIAQRYRVRERELVVINNLRSRHRIRAGQVLVLPDHASGRQTTVARSAPPSDGIYRVRRGDTLSIIAQRFGVSESALAAENGLRNRNRIVVGQRLRIPGAQPLVVASAAPTPTAAEKVSVSTASEATKTPAVAAVATGTALPRAVPATATTAGTEIASAQLVPADYPPNIPAPDPSDYAVGRDDRITVQAAETLGHYAEWLEVQTSRLRRLNRMTYDTPVVIGRPAKLDFRRVTPETFEQRRLRYHHALQEEYFSAFEVIGTRTHTLRPGDTLWYLAERKYEVPVWLIRQFNPDLDFGALQAGTRMIIPEVGPRTS
jgi:membrane-bound lytic murein transglycosylase D